MPTAAIAGLLRNGEIKTQQATRTDLQLRAMVRRKVSDTLCTNAASGGL